MLISPIMRACLPTVPNLSAPAAGTGKSFLCDLAAALATGFPCVVMSAGKDEEELEKRLSSAVLDGMAVAVIDNVSRALGGDFLCQMLDRPMVKIRVLGKSEGPKLEPRLILFATGNNLSLIGDISRRAVIAHLDAGCENPFQRQFADDPLTRILRDRGRYIAAVLTLCKAFKVSGDPPEARLASFEHWSDIVRSAIIWVGGGDAVRTIAAITADDPERECHAAVLAAWDEQFGSNPVTVTDLIQAALRDRWQAYFTGATRHDGGGRREGRSEQSETGLLAAATPRQGFRPTRAAAIDHCPS
jgi:putative DNA primase/helicase